MSIAANPSTNSPTYATTNARAHIYSYVSTKLRAVLSTFYAAHKTASFTPNKAANPSTNSPANLKADPSHRTAFITSFASANPSTYFTSII